MIVLFLIGTAPSKLNPTVYLVLMNEITTDLSNVLLLVKLRGFGPQRHVYFVVLAQLIVIVLMLYCVDCFYITIRH